MPGDDLTHGPPATKKAGGSHHRFGRINRHSLRDGLRLISRSPRGPGFLAPVIGVMRSIIANLTSASGGQDHATSPSAQGTFVLRAIRVHRIPAPRVVTIARTSLFIEAGCARGSF
jgi:hypothetical protein